VKEEVKDKVMAMLEQMGQAVADKAKELCPVDTGQLKNSIGYTIVRSDMTVQIHADQSYAYFIEFGTRLMAARPFLRPALLAARNWGNRGVNTEMQFQAINSPGTMPSPRANHHALEANHRINKGLDKKFKGVKSLVHSRPKIVFHGKTARSQTGRRTHAIHERFSG
jgi:HK97 gp10 family phage protein